MFNTSIKKDAIIVLMETNRIDSLVKNESGHFTSNYVCVIAIDDGRFFIDYHYSDNPIKYGIGRLFSHSHINGVNYSEHKYVQGGKDRLSLVALYDCESEEDAINKFSIVFKAYKNKYGDRVFSNKNTTNKKPVIIKASKGELRIPVSNKIPITRSEDKKDNQAVDKWFFLSKCTFPIEMQYGTESFQGVPTHDVFLKATQDLGHRKFTIKMDKPEGFRPRYKQEYGTQILVDSAFEVYMRLGWVITVTARTSFESSPVGAESFSVCSGLLSYGDRETQYQKVNELSHYRVQDYFSIFQFSIFPMENGVDRYQLQELYSILTSGNVYIKLGDIRCYLHHEQIDYIKRNLIIFGAIEEVVHDNYRNVYEAKKDSWLTAKGFDSDANRRFQRRTEVGKFTINRKTKEATFIGHSGDKYITTLRSCTCEDFKERDSWMSAFTPCKHMFRLATELGYFKGLSRLPFDRSSSSFLELLDSKARYGYPSGFSTETCEPWKMPFIVLRPMVRWTDLRTGSTGSIELFLGFRNIIFDPTPGIGFDDSEYLKCRIHGENGRLEDIYLDVQDTGHYRITQIPADIIYKHLLDETQFDLEVYIYGEDQPAYIFSFPKTKGFGGLFQSHYQRLLDGR